MPKIVSRYGWDWPDNLSELQIEMACINQGLDTGFPLGFHYERARQIIWPHLKDHRWNTLCRDEILANKVTVLMGPKSTGKTHAAAWVRLLEYLCFPQETCVLVSSTDMRGLELRVWGEIKSLHGMAVERFPELPGHLLDSKHCISTDDIDEASARDLRKGIIGIPCIQNGKFVGLGKYAGIKQKRMRLIADEAQFMGASFLSAFANLDGNEDFQAIVLGNPQDPMDPLGNAAEPREGWSKYMSVEKTTVWDTRFMNGRCINLIGTDSPNFDDPAQPNRFPFLINQQKIANTLSFFDPSSLEYRSQCIGNMSIATLERRVITRELCQQFKAQAKVTWKGTPLVKIASLDAAYGGDRCVLGWGEFGEDVDGQVKLFVYKPVIVPLRAGRGMIIEDEIAEYVKEFCLRHRIPPENFFHDSTGRGSLGTSLARRWSAQCNPVEFGGKPTERPVSMDHYIFDAAIGQRRLKRCDEHYSKFVTELWYSCRYAIEADQVRGLATDVMDEGCLRQWEYVKGDKIEVESKEEMKVRVGRSPDLFDQFSILVEGARQRGFQIKKLANPEVEAKVQEYLRKLYKESRDVALAGSLNYGEN